MNLALEFLQWSRDAVPLDDTMQFVNKVDVKLVDRRTLFLRITAVVDADLLVRVVELPGLTLVLVVKVNDEQWVLEVDEEVTHIRHFLWLLLILDNVKSRVSPFVVTIDFVLQFFLRISAWDVLHAKVGSQIMTLLHQS